MIQIENITNEPHQRHTILFEESEIVLNLRYLPIIKIWIIDIEYKDKNLYGFKLSSGVLHFRSQNLPFDFYIEDLTGNGLDPVRLDDFAENRCSLYMMEAADMETIRGASVKI